MSTQSKARLRLWLRLLKATRGVEAELRDRLRAEFGQTLPRFDVMAALARRPEGLKMSEISDMLRVSNGNVTPIVERLVAEGLAERSAVQGDRRATRVTLTPAGRTAFALQAAAHETWLDAMFKGLGAEEAAMLSAALARIGERVEP